MTGGEQVEEGTREREDKRDTRGEVGDSMGRR